MVLYEDFNTAACDAFKFYEYSSQLATQKMFLQNIVKIIFLTFFSKYVILLFYFIFFRMADLVQKVQTIPIDGSQCLLLSQIESLGK